MLEEEIKERNRKAVEAMELTPKEVEDAIYQAKLKKFFHERSLQYYIDQEKICNESNVRQTKLSRVNKTIDSV